MPRQIILETHKPSWLEKFQQEAKSLQKIFGQEMLSIHHIGSTSIADIKAKPIIDILVVLKDTDGISGFDVDMIQLGYVVRGQCLDAEVPGTVGRFYYSKNIDDIRSHQVHIMKIGHEDIEAKLAFRDYLRQHPDIAKRYTKLKEIVAKQNPNDIVGYINGKNDFIKSTIVDALAWYRRRT